MKSNYLLLGILATVICIGTINWNHATALEPDDLCTSYKLEIIQAENRDDLMNMANSFIADKDVREISGVIERYIETLYIEYCDNSESTCKNKFGIIAEYERSRIAEAVNSFTVGKAVRDISLAFWEERTDVYILYCEESKSNVKPVDFDGDISKGLNVSEPAKIDKGDLVGIESAVTNSMAEKVNFAYIVQIKGEQDSIVFLTYVENISVLDDPVKPTVFWLAEHDGRYNAEVFVWQSIDEPVPLAPVKSISFEV
jgi:hypothetical protein